MPPWRLQSDILRRGSSCFSLFFVTRSLNHVSNECNENLEISRFTPETLNVTIMKKDQITCKVAREITTQVTTQPLHASIFNTRREDLTETWLPTAIVTLLIGAAVRPVAFSQRNRRTRLVSAATVKAWQGGHAYAIARTSSRHVQAKRRCSCTTK
jgi:hypothetical protein